MLKGEVKNESFVLHANFVATLPEEVTGEWVLYIINYGLCGIEPIFTDWMSRELWLKIKERIDADRASYETRKEKNKKRVKEWREKNGMSETSVTHGNACNALQPLPCVTPNTQCVSVSDSVFDSDSVSVFDSVSEFVSESVSESVSVSDATDAPSSDYSSVVFDMWRDAGLPCCNTNYIQFIQRDFKNALEKLHEGHYTSDEVIKAGQNYIAELQKDDSYVTTKMNFNAFVRSKQFENCLPDNYDPVNFKKFDKEEESKEPVTQLVDTSGFRF